MGTNMCNRNTGKCPEPQQGSKTLKSASDFGQFSNRPAAGSSADVAGTEVSPSAVTGATGYRALYWPLITAHVEITEDTDVAGAVFGWTLTAEEA